MTDPEQTPGETAFVVLLGIVIVAMFLALVLSRGRHTADMTARNVRVTQ